MKIKNKCLKCSQFPLIDHYHESDLRYKLDKILCNDLEEERIDMLEELIKKEIAFALQIEKNKEINNLKKAEAQIIYNEKENNPRH